MATNSRNIHLNKVFLKKTISKDRLKQWQCHVTDFGAVGRTGDTVSRLL